MRIPHARPRHLPVALLLLLLFLLPTPRPAQADGALAAVESQFRAAIQRVLAATVVCLPWHVPAGSEPGFSSGVIVSADGLVLSDGDAGLRFVGHGRGGERTRVRDDEVRVRLPGSRTLRARVLRRDVDADTSLLRIVDPGGSLPYVPVGNSDGLGVGDFVFALGTAFDEEGRTPPTLTSGLVAALTHLPAGDRRGRYEFAYTSAAVNQGVNGGPLVDLDGRLVGTISTYLNPTPQEPFQFLGKAIPMNRLREVYRGMPEAARLFATPPPPSPTATPAHALQTTVRMAAARAWPWVVSLEVRRARPVSGLAPLDRGQVNYPRYQGPVSAVLISRDGWIVTALYNLTNVSVLAEPAWEPQAPPEARPEAGLAAVREVTAHLPGGHAVPARLVGHDVRWGVALLKADVGSLAARGVAFDPVLPELAAPIEDPSGRFLVALGNPFGASRPPTPLATFGIVSKEHPDDVAAAWRGQWQTDAAGLDTNAGGPVVDLDGRLMGMLTLWNPARHGRNSGIAFVVPWARIEAALPALREGRGPTRGFLGVLFAGGLAARVREVTPGSAAERHGLRPGDVIRRVGSEEITTATEAVAAIGVRFVGERVDLAIERDGAVRVLAVTLGPRPETR